MGFENIENIETLTSRIAFFFWRPRGPSVRKDFDGGAAARSPQGDPTPWKRCRQGWLPWPDDGSRAETSPTTKYRPPCGGALFHSSDASAWLPSSGQLSHPCPHDPKTLQDFTTTRPHRPAPPRSHWPIAPRQASRSPRPRSTRLSNRTIYH